MDPSLPGDNDPPGSKIDDEDTKPKTCDAKAEGTVETRIRFESATVAHNDTCAPEEQSRTCKDGKFGDWDGTFTEKECEVSKPLACGNIAHGKTASRFVYQSLSVGYGQTCKKQTQTRTCENGEFGEWSSTSYSKLTCTIQDPAACGSIANGDEDERLRFQTATVPNGQQCVSQKQTSTCTNGEFGNWSGTYTHPVCVELPPPPAKCGNIASGGKETRIRYENLEVAYDLSCKKETQTSTCTNGKMSTWSGSFSEVECTKYPLGYLIGKVKILVVQVNEKYKNPNPHTAEQLRKRLFTDADSVAARLRARTNGRAQLEEGKIVYQPGVVTGLPYQCNGFELSGQLKESRELIKDLVNPADYQMTMFIWPVDKSQHCNSYWTANTAVIFNASSSQAIWDVLNRTSMTIVDNTPKPTQIKNVKVKIEYPGQNLKFGNVEWDRLVGDNIKYRVEVRAPGLSEFALVLPSFTNQNYDTNSRSYTAERAVNGFYELRVHAVNSGGFGPPSEVIKVPYPQP